MPKNASSEKKSHPFNTSFLLNANISRILVAKLYELFGFNVIHVSALSKGSLSDAEVITFAKKQARIIITHDLDYGEIYYLKEKGNIGVIMLRLKDQTSTNVLSKLAAFFTSDQCNYPKLAKSLVIIEDARVRIFTP